MILNPDGGVNDSLLPWVVIRVVHNVVEFFQPSIIFPNLLHQKYFPAVLYRIPPSLSPDSATATSAQWAPFASWRPSVACATSKFSTCATVSSTIIAHQLWEGHLTSSAWFNLSCLTIIFQIPSDNVDEMI